MVGRANLGLAEYQQIRRVLRWPDLQFPYTSTGKLLRRKVAGWADAAFLNSQQGGADRDGGEAAVLRILMVRNIVQNVKRKSRDSRTQPDCAAFFFADALGKRRPQGTRPLSNRQGQG